MSKYILITGGAGFIGLHLCDALINQKNHNLAVFDILEEQVHGKVKKTPSYLNRKVEFIR